LWFGGFRVAGQLRSVEESTSAGKQATENLWWDRKDILHGLLKSNVFSILYGPTKSRALIKSIRTVACAFPRIGRVLPGDRKALVGLRPSFRPTYASVNAGHLSDSFGVLWVLSSLRSRALRCAYPQQSG
jgi:hypothetical protein